MASFPAFFRSAHSVCLKSFSLGMACRPRSRLQARALREARARGAVPCPRSAPWSGSTIWPALKPTNNAAEQALRSLVLKRKISGPTRSLRGDQFLSHGFTAHETCLRQGVDLWKFVYEAVTAFIANTTPPSLMPRPIAAAPTG